MIRSQKLPARDEITGDSTGAVRRFPSDMLPALLRAAERGMPVMTLDEWRHRRRGA